MNIKFQKQYMTIQELVDIGFYSHATLQRWVNIRCFPAIKSEKCKNFTLIIDTNQI